MPRNTTETEVTGWVGWVYFAAFMMFIMGMFQTIFGLTALLNDKFYVAAKGTLLVLDYTQWGWIHLIFGIVTLIAATSLFSGHLWARIVAALLATVNLMVQFAFLSVYPVWSIITMVVDVVVIYALIVHGGEVKVED
jgi:hypothetical protein